MRPRPLTLALLVALVVSVALFAVLAVRPTPRAPAVEVATPSAEPTPTPTVVVDLQGAVARPGVYRLPAGTRIADALAAAGGLLPEAEPAALNRAALLRDGARIYAPVRGEQPPAGALGTDAERVIDLNRASAPELTGLPGIGPSTADRIIRSRQKAPFRSVEELQLRGLVSPRVLADIRDLVSVR